MYIIGTHTHTYIYIYIYIYIYNLYTYIYRERLGFSLGQVGMEEGMRTHSRIHA